MQRNFKKLKNFFYSQNLYSFSFIKFLEKKSLLFLSFKFDFVYDYFIT